jgi:hypothetical protein
MDDGTAYFTAVVSYEREIFMELTTGLKSEGNNNLV